MPITQKHIDQAYADLKAICGGVRDDYFGLVYLEQTYKLSREEARLQIAFGGNDYGIDGFYIDPESRNLYLFQFKWSTTPGLFKGSFKRLIEAGMERVFGNPKQDQHLNQVLLQLKGQLFERQNLIDRVLIHFVFKGDPEEAERSQALDKLREDLEGKKYLVEQYFERPVTLAIQYRSATRRVGSVVHRRVTHAYDIDVDSTLEQLGPDGEKMRVGLVRLMDLGAIYRDMGPRFFERNIRYGLTGDQAPNRAIARALKEIVLDAKENPSVFAFNHNGVTIYAEKLEPDKGKYRLVEPRLLNGAQTITTFDRFLKKNEGNARLKQRSKELQELKVLCKFITAALPEFVVSVTINNNRQNPVMPWDLHANDMIQLELQDKFRDELGIYYQRQKEAFANLTQEDLDELEITEYKAVEMLRLAQTFLASDGEIDKLIRLREVFESDHLYSQVFHPNRLQADLRLVILCYKVQFRLRRLIREIEDKGQNKYAYMTRARNLLWALLCQAMLNDDRVKQYAEWYGTTMSIEANYTEWLATLSSTKARFLIRDVVKPEPYATLIAEGRYDFLRNRAVYERCMDLAKKKWGWTQKRLR